MVSPHEVKNKIKRKELVKKQKSIQKKEKKLDRKQRKLEGNLFDPDTQEIKRVLTKDIILKDNELLN